MTSFDMKGIQISLLRLSGHEEWLKLLDAETDAVAWPGSSYSFEHRQSKIEIKKDTHKKTVIFNTL